MPKSFEIVEEFIQNSEKCINFEQVLAPVFGKRKEIFIKNKYFETEKQIFAKQNSKTNDYEKYLWNLGTIDVDTS